MSEQFPSAYSTSDTHEQPFHQRAAEAREAGDETALDQLQSEYDAHRDELRSRGARRVIFLDVRDNPDAAKPLSWGVSENDTFWQGYKENQATTTDSQVRRDALANQIEVTTASGRDVGPVYLPAHETGSASPETGRGMADVAEKMATFVGEAKGKIPFKRIDLPTETGTIAVETSESEPGITIEQTVVRSGEEGEVIEDIIIDGDDGQHQIELIESPNTEPVVTYDGEQPTDLNTIANVVEHIRESLRPIVEQSAQEPAETVTQPTAEQTVSPKTSQEQKTPQPEKAPRMTHAESFMKNMMMNPGARETVMQSLAETGINTKDFAAGLKNNDLPEDVAADMKKLFKQYPPSSGIWSERENSGSQLGRVAHDAKDRLRAIVQRLHSEPL